MMKRSYFINQLKKAEQSKTLYVMGCFGAPMTATNKTRYKNNNKYNNQPSRQKMIDNATSDTFGFDCVCLIKGILWGWDAKTDKVYGGASYMKDGIPDYDAKQFFNLCTGISSNFKGIQPGCMVWMEGHCGVYVGDGKVIESTPKWKNCVQYSNLGNNGYKTGNWRNWTKWGFIPYVDYSDEEDNKPDNKPDDNKEDDGMKYYEKIDNVPSYYKEGVQWFIDNGCLYGKDKNGTLDISEDMCRTLTVLYRFFNTEE